jgi:hypothetical protein
MIVSKKMKWHVAAAVVALFSGANPASADRLECRAKLSPDQEVVLNPTPPPAFIPAVIDADTKGRAEVEFNKALTKADFKLRVNDGVQITQAHIHCGAAGANGPIVAFLAGLFGTPTSQDVDGKWIDNATLIDDSVISRPAGPGGCAIAVNTLADIAALARDRLTYVNVHSKAYPGGVARGQLRCDGGEDDDDDHRSSGGGHRH